MIIFDLDGTLADCEHRRHFVDPKKNDYAFWFNAKDGGYWAIMATSTLDDPDGPVRWKPDWKSFYENCDKDLPIQQLITCFDELNDNLTVEIWSGRCESTREKTLRWLDDNVYHNNENIEYINRHLKMRPMGDPCPDYVLKESWLNQQCSDMIEWVIKGKKFPEKHNIDFVFSSDLKTIEMFRARGIFVFDCSQTGEKF